MKNSQKTYQIISIKIKISWYKIHNPFNLKLSKIIMLKTNKKSKIHKKNKRFKYKSNKLKHKTLQQE